MNQKLLTWLPLIVYLLLTFVVSSMPQSMAEPRAMGIPTYLIHAAEFFVLAVLVLRVLLFYKVKQPFMMAILCTVAYASFDEMHQLFVPGRSGELLDVIVDTIGSFFVLIFKNKKLRKIIE